MGLTDRNLGILLGLGILLVAGYLWASNYLGGVFKEQLHEHLGPFATIQQLEKGVLSSTFSVSPKIGGNLNLKVDHYPVYSKLSRSFPFVRISALRASVKLEKLPKVFRESNLKVANLSSKINFFVDKSFSINTTVHGADLFFPTPNGNYKLNTKDQLLIFLGIGQSENNLTFGLRGTKTKVQLPKRGFLDLGQFAVFKNVSLHQLTNLNLKLQVRAENGKTRFCGNDGSCKSQVFDSIEGTIDGDTLISKKISRYNLAESNLSDAVNYFSSQLSLWTRQRSPGKLAMNFKYHHKGLEADLVSQIKSKGPSSPVAGSIRFVAFPLNSVKVEFNKYLPDYFNNLVLDRWITVDGNQVRTSITLQNDQFYVNGRRANLPSRAH